MSNQIYYFVLSCEGNGETKTETFATIRSEKELARKHAEETNKRKYPIKDGWYNHQTSMLVAPKEINRCSIFGYICLRLL